LSRAGGEIEEGTYGDDRTDGTDDVRHEGLHLADGAVLVEADEVVVDSDLSGEEEGGGHALPLLCAKKS